MTPENTEEAIKCFLMIVLFVVLGTDALVRGSYLTWWYILPKKRRKQPYPWFCIHYRKDEPLQFWIYVCLMYGMALGSVAYLCWGMKYGFN